MLSYEQVEGKPRTTHLAQQTADININLMEWQNNNVSDDLNINGSSDTNTSNDTESCVNNGVVNDNDIIISLLVASMGNERANILNINSIPVNDN